MPRPKRMIRAGLATQIFEMLERQILDFELEPGSQLVIDQLAKELGVSITPVREALARLASNRLLNFNPYRGYTVPERPNSEDIANSYEARLAIEPFAARLGAKRMTAEQFSEMEELEQRIASGRYTEESASFLEFVHANRRFHTLVVETSGNPYLVEAWKSLHHDELVAFVLHGRGIPDLNDIHKEHRQIVRAFRLRDPDASYKAVTNHAERACMRILEAIQVPSSLKGQGDPRPTLMRRTRAAQ